MPEATPDSSTTTDGTDTGGTTSTATDEFKPITSQEELNKVVGERVKRAEAKFGDYKDLKAKAGRLDEIEQANKSEIDKAMDRVTKAEAEVATVPAKVADALRSHLVALHEIPSDEADLFLTATDPDLLLRQVKGLMDRSAAAKPSGYVPTEGANSTAAPSDERQAARALFGGSTT